MQLHVMTPNILFGIHMSADGKKTFLRNFGTLLSDYTLLLAVRPQYTVICLQNLRVFCISVLYYFCLRCTSDRN